MANNCGKFIASKFMNKKLEMFIGLSSEWLTYADGDAQSYTIIIATPVEYDEPSGVLTLRNDRGQKFYVNQESIQMFWEDTTDFKLIENTSSTIRSGKQWLKGQNTTRDIM